MSHAHISNYHFYFKLTINSCVLRSIDVVVRVDAYIFH